MNTGPLAVAAGSFSVEKVRQDFPILHTTMRGKPLTYLDSAASSQKPYCVIDAIDRYYREQNANIHRGVYYLSQRATDLYEGARETVRVFLNAAEAREIIFLRGTTEAINLVAQTWGWENMEPGDEVVVSTMEHHSNIVPWQILRDRKGIVIRVIPIDDPRKERSCADLAKPGYAHRLHPRLPRGEPPLRRPDHGDSSPSRLQRLLSRRGVRRSVLLSRLPERQILHPQREGHALRA